jgi:glycosyltransferase involved in cell wall biosynthesis
MRENKIVSIILPYYNRKEYLIPTLESFEYFYNTRDDLQIVIVDDGSDDPGELENITHKYDIWTDIVYIKNKKGINPCYPYNVGVRHSKGDIIVLSSPEIVHTYDMFEISKNFNELNNSNYLQFSVFCLTDQNLKNMLMSNAHFHDKIKSLEMVLPKFERLLGIHGYLYANDLGAWYTHSKYQRNCFNFLSACTRKTYYELSGFNEAFVYGTGYDDTEFRDRMLKYVDNKVIWYDAAVAIHIDHPTCSSDNNTNLGLYQSLTTDSYENNDAWGLL